PQGARRPGGARQACVRQNRGSDQGKPCALNNLEDIVSRALAEFASSADPASLENAKAKFLGKTGELTALLKQLGSLGPEEKKSFGQRIHAAKQQSEAPLDACRNDLELNQRESRLAGEALDVTLPGRG